MLRATAHTITVKPIFDQELQMMVRMGVVAILGVLASSAFGAAAQDRILDASRQVGDKQITDAARPRVAAEAIVRLENLPQEMVKMHTGDGWLEPKRTPGPRVGVTRTGAQGGNCRQPSDSLDLRRARMNGFSVVSYSLEEAPGPKGYRQAASTNVRAYRRNKERLLNATSNAEIDVINISPGPWVVDVPGRGGMIRIGCQATWQLTITMKGPRGIDPITGRAR